MNFKKTYKIVDTGYQRNIYYYIDNKRVSCDIYYDKKILCEIKRMQYNSSLLYTNKNGRTVETCCFN